MPAGHIPHGMCGLKWLPPPGRTDPASSHPSRDVWIEMLNMVMFLVLLMSHPSRDVWIEIGAASAELSADRSHIPHGMCGLKWPVLSPY